MNVAPPDPFGITVLRSRGLRLAKRWRLDDDGALAHDAYDDAATFSASVVRARDLRTLGAVLRRLAGLPCACVVRAEPLPDIDWRAMRRLLHPKVGTMGEIVAPPTLRAVPRSWVALDFDGLDAPTGWHLDLPAAAPMALAALPECFRGAGHIVQATGSAGFKPGLRIRLWFMLAEPATTADLTRTLRAVPGLDLSTLRPAQIIYTAAPVLDGIADPVPHRFALVDGPPVRLVVSPEPERPAQRHGTASAHAGRALAGLCRVVETAPEGRRHPALYWAGRRCGERIARGELAPAVAVDALVGAARASGLDDPPHELARFIGVALRAGAAEGAR